MQFLLNFVKWIGYALALLAAIFLILLTFYIGGHDYVVADGTRYTLASALKLLIEEFPTWSRSPQHLSVDDDAALKNAGNALVYALSLLFMLLSGLTVVTRLNTIQEILPYKKYNLFWVRRVYFWFGSSLAFYPRWHAYVEGRIALAYKNLSVKKMTHFYSTAERLCICSGDYTWLFNRKWGRSVRDAINHLNSHDVRLISFRNPKDVINHWATHPNYRELKPIFEKIAFVRMQNEYNGTIVDNGVESLYIYLHKNEPKSSMRSSVCAFYAVREARTVVGIVQDDFQRLYNEGVGDPGRNQEKEKILADANFF